MSGNNYPNSLSLLIFEKKLHVTFKKFKFFWKYPKAFFRLTQMDSSPFLSLHFNHGLRLRSNPILSQAKF